MHISHPTFKWFLLGLAVFGFVLLTMVNNAMNKAALSEKHSALIDVLNSAEERSIIVFKDGEMGSVVRVPGGRTFEVKENCGSELTRRTRTSWFLERVQKVVRVNDPNYLELRTEFITRCLFAR